MTKTIALTGGTGFVGGHLLNFLCKKGFKVNALTRRDQPSQKGIKWIKGDFKNKDAIEKLINDADIIINVAGLVKAKNKEEFIEANTTAVKTLLSEIKSQESKPHFIQISSLAAREQDISYYAHSKHLAEEIIKNNNTDLNFTIIRPPGIYGPGDTETLKIFKLLKWRFAFYPSDKHSRVSWIHVNDLVTAIFSLMENKGFYGKTLEIDDGHSNGYSHAEFYKTAASAMKLDYTGITIPKFILKISGHINAIFGAIFGYAPMVSDKKVNELCHPDWVCKNDPGFVNSVWEAEYNLESGLSDTLNWYKKNNYL